MVAFASRHGQSLDGFFPRQSEGHDPRSQPFVELSRFQFLRQAQILDSQGRLRPAQNCRIISALRLKGIGHPAVAGARNPREDIVTILKTAALAFVLAFASFSASAQTPAPSYGPPITLEAAKKAMAAAEAEAIKNNWIVAISILDSTGHPVMMQRFDGLQYASLRIAQGKARTALDFRRPTKALQDAVAAGGAGLRLLSVPGAMLLEGGVLIVVDGKIVGSIGVSGVTSEQDAQIATAGANAVK
jgi:glc operon protein GlcG